MSKRELKKYVRSLDKEQLEEQVLDLYSRFKDVKAYYDFAFNPQENKIMEECRFKISKEYFPVKGRKAKMRRSVAQKYIRRFKQIGVNPVLIADVMLYNIEIAQTYAAERSINQDSFYTSMFKSFDEAVQYIRDNALQKDFYQRLDKIADQAAAQGWFNSAAFERVLSE